MSVMKIPDLILEKLSCQCGRYLSKPPINIRDGQIVCSDCVEMHAPQFMVTRSVPYEALASLYAFPCKYKSQGCEKYVEFPKMDDHEAVCAYKTYICPSSLHSTCIWRGAISLLYQHYKEQHPELCTGMPDINIHVNEDYEMYHLVKVEDVLLLLQIKCVLEQNKLWFNMVYLGAETDVPLINYCIELKGVSTIKPVIMLGDATPMPIAKMQIIPEESLSVSGSTLMDIFKHPEFIKCRWIVTLTGEFRNRIITLNENERKEWFEENKERIKCPNCRIYMVPPIYRCNQGHITCLDCKGYLNECKLCEKINVHFAVAADLDIISKSGRHYCRWLNCRREFSYNVVREHERTCASRVYRCPECSIWTGNCNEILNHFNTVQHTPVYHHKATKFYNDLTRLKMENGSFYTFMNSDFFKIHVELDGPNIHISIWYLGCVSFVDCWNFQLQYNCGGRSVAKIAYNKFGTTIIWNNYLRNTNFSLYIKKIK